MFRHGPLVPRFYKTLRPGEIEWVTDVQGLLEP